ncbi:phosphoinositide 3-kinase regulatory subunit 5-like isoform 2-T2 [Aulostomus maculatus]
MPQQMMEHNSCTEDRIQHALERCLCGLGLNTPDKQLWNAGLCINRWCLEELVRRDPLNFLILLQKILRKTKEVLEQCQYELVGPLALLFSSALLKTPYLAPDCSVLQDAYKLFSCFLSWPDPCCSASKHLLNILHHELRAPGISFQRLVRTEQGLYPKIFCSKTLTVLLVSPDEDIASEVQSVSEQLSSIQQSSRDITIALILHGFQAALGTKHDLSGLHNTLQTKPPEELESLLETVIDSMETAASMPDPGAARHHLLQTMETLTRSLVGPISADSCSDARAVQTFALPIPKCYTCSWEKDNFDFLNDILTREPELDASSDCFLRTEEGQDGNTDTSVDKEDEKKGIKLDQNIQNHHLSTASSSRDSMLSVSLSSSWTVVPTPSPSSGVESNFSEDTGHESTEEGKNSQHKPRKKPQKKSRSLLLFKNPCRVQGMDFNDDLAKDFRKIGSLLKHSKPKLREVHPRQAPASTSPFMPQSQVCVSRRPILSCSGTDMEQVIPLIRVVVFGGDKEAGRLARAYSNLQQKESKCPQFTKMCTLQFYFVPTKRRTAGEELTLTEGLTGSSTKAAVSVECCSLVQEDNTNDIAQMLGKMDPWYERNILSLLSLSPDVLCQSGSVSKKSSSIERLPLLADMVLYYCRNADQPALVQLYKAEFMLAGGERRTEVFLHSVELGHTAATRAVKAMGAASKRFGLDEEREAVPLPLNVAYNKVAVSGRSQWIQAEMVCTSINLYKTCKKPEQLDSNTGSLWLTVTEVLKRQCFKSKKSYNRFSISEVKVDKVEVTGRDEETTFAVCLDQDEKKFVQSVTRFKVSLCCKQGSGSDWRSYKHSPRSSGQIQPLHPSYCSLLCLPIISFSTSHP